MRYDYFRNRAEYITVMSLITVIAFMVFTSLHLDYDENVDRLWKKVKLDKKDNWTTIKSTIALQPVSSWLTMKKTFIREENWKKNWIYQISWNGFLYLELLNLFDLELQFCYPLSVFLWYKNVAIALSATNAMCPTLQTQTQAMISDRQSRMRS